MERRSEDLTPRITRLRDAVRRKYMVKRVRFSDKVQVYLVPIEDRTPNLAWMFDRMRFTDRINKTEQLLKPILTKKIDSINNGTKE